MMEPMMKKETTEAVLVAVSTGKNSERPGKAAMLCALSVLAMFHVPMRTCRIVTAAATDDAVSEDLAAPVAAVRRFWTEGSAEAGVTDEGVADAMCAYAYAAGVSKRPCGTPPPSTTGRLQDWREAVEPAMGRSGFDWEPLFSETGADAFDRRMKWQIAAAPGVSEKALATAGTFLSALGLPVTAIRRAEGNVSYVVTGERFRRVMTAFAAYTTGLFTVTRFGADEGKFAAADDVVNPLEAYFEPSLVSGRSQVIHIGRDRFSVRLSPLGWQLVQASVP